MVEPEASRSHPYDPRRAHPRRTRGLRGTNGSQFFPVYADTGLPPSCTVFGTFDAAGLKVAQGIAQAGTADGGGDGAPKQDVVITSVR